MRCPSQPSTDVLGTRKFLSDSGASQFVPQRDSNTEFECQRDIVSHAFSIANKEHKWYSVDQPYSDKI